MQQLSSSDSAAVLLQKIQALAKVNCEIIARIKATEVVVSSSYWVKSDTSSSGISLSVSEEKVVIEAHKIVASWKNSRPLNPCA